MEVTDMKIDFGFGAGVQQVDIPDGNLLGILRANEVTPEDTEQAMIEKALRQPIGSKPLQHLVKPGSKVAIITSDITRPLPT